MLRTLLACAAVCALTIPASAQPSDVPVRRVGAATLQGVPEISLAISAAVQRYQNSRSAQFQDWMPDGSMLIATRFGATQQIHHVATPGAARTQITFGTEPVGRAISIPGTERFVISRDTGGDEWFQLYARGLAGEPVQLTEPGTRNQGAVFSKDGALLVWARASKGTAAYSLLATDPRQPAAPRTIFQSDGAISPADISADKTKILFTRGLSNRESQIFILDLGTGKATRIAPKAEAALYQDVRFLPGDQSIIAISDRGSDKARLVEINLANGTETVLTPKLNWNVESYDLADGGRILAYAVNEDGYSRVELQDRVSKTPLARPPLPKGVLTALKFSPDGKKLALGITNAKSAGDVWSWDIDKGELVRWTQSELGELNPAELAEPELIRFESFDGLSVPAFVYRPAGIAPGTRTPVIIDIHGGPEAQTRPVWNYGAQYFVDILKATVILPNVRGSDGYGKHYLNLDNAEKREDSVKDIGALLDWIGAQPDLDASKVAVYGQSYGGYMSLAVMTHYSDRLVGGVERYGISDWVSFLNNTEAYRRDNRRAEYGDERDPKMRAIFAKISPLANVGKIKKPMLVMQGANDPRVPQSESEQVVAKLRESGIDTWYVLFADEGHGFLKKHNNDLRREVETLFLQRLFGQDPAAADR